jgi:thiosulfate reductase cytochrome b subunit
LRWMHWWLIIHVPAAVVLLIFLVAHVVMALRVVPFGI